MRRSAVPIVAAVLIAGLTGCGSSSTKAVASPFSALCIDAGLPLSGPDGAAARGVLAGLRMEIPRAGLTVGAYRVRLCRVSDDGAQDQNVVSNVRRASENFRTIAYVGELSGSEAQVADTLLAQSGIALITPSGPVPTPAVTPSAGPGAVATPPARRTALYLLPAARTEWDAVRDVRSAHGCQQRRHGQRRCTVLAVAAAPLCTGAGSAAAGARPRFCVLAGPDLAGWESPAVAYGDGAGRLLVSSLKAIADRGKDVADRATVFSQLSGANLAGTPIGTIRFDSAGGIRTDAFTAYTVRANGGLVLSETSFRAH